MPWDNQVNPAELYMTGGEATQRLGIDRNQLRTLCMHKKIEWDHVMGRNYYYRTSVEAYYDKYVAKKGPVNPYAKTPETQHGIA